MDKYAVCYLILQKVFLQPIFMFSVALIDNVFENVTPSQQNQPSGC